METDITNDDFVHDSNYKRIYIKQNIMPTKDLSIEEKAKRYDEILARAKAEYAKFEGMLPGDVLEDVIHELKELDDEKIRKALLNEFTSLQSKGYKFAGLEAEEFIAWLEKQGSEPNWCHHKVDLSNCSEEYRKAYYDGWNNCNMQHSQCNAERNDVVKCLINGMKFYYEDNKEAMWGTEKFSMKVKDILNWLEKQGEPVEINPTEFDTRLQVLIGKFGSLPKEELIGSLSFWMNVVQNDGTYKPAEKQIEPKFIAEP